MEIGSIVECMNDSGISPKARILTPKKGHLYTVTGFCEKGRGAGIYIDECNSIIKVAYRSGQKNLEQAPFLKTRFIERLPPVKIEIEAITHQEI